MKDNWEKYLKNSLNHIIIRKWRKSSSKIKELFINNKKSKHLIIDKNDIIFARNVYKRNMIKNQVIFDIDNIITIFTNLLMINIIIEISIVSNLIRNLKESIYLTY